MFSLLNNVGSPDSLLKPPKIMGRSPRLNACSSSWRRSGRRRSAELLGCKANARGSKSLQPRCGLINVQHARDETRPSPQSSLWGDSPAG